MLCFCELHVEQDGLSIEEHWKGVAVSAAGFAQMRMRAKRSIAGRMGCPYPAQRLWWLRLLVRQAGFRLRGRLRLP